MRSRYQRSQSTGAQTEIRLLRPNRRLVQTQKSVIVIGFKDRRESILMTARLVQQSMPTSRLLGGIAAQSHRDLGAILDHMIVGNDVAVLARTEKPGTFSLASAAVGIVIPPPLVLTWRCRATGNFLVEQKLPIRRPFSSTGRTSTLMATTLSSTFFANCENSLPMLVIEGHR